MKTNRILVVLVAVVGVCTLIGCGNSDKPPVRVVPANGISVTMPGH